MHVVQFGDEGKVTRNLPVIFDQEALLLELPEFHILKCKLSDRKTRETLKVDAENIVAAIPLQRVLKRPHLSSAQRHRRKEIVLHSVHGTNYVLKHLFVALRIDHLDLFGNHKRSINQCFSMGKQESEEIKHINLDDVILTKLFIYTPTLKRELTGLWSLVCSSMWLLYLSWLTLFPLQRILSHQAGTRHFPLHKSEQFLQDNTDTRHTSTQPCWLCRS